MGDNSDIEWTDATWNPVVGCSKVSPGCAHCYAETMGNRLRAMAIAKREAGEEPGRLRHYVDAVDNQGRWTGSLIPVPEAITEPLTWKKPRMIFVNSMSDLFHESVQASFIAEVFATMYEAQWHTFQVLTKRADRMPYLLSNALFLSGMAKIVHGRLQQTAPEKAAVVTESDILDDIHDCWPLRNVWLGVSVEDQKRTDERVPHLLKTPAAVRFLSIEPLLGPISFRWAKWQKFSDVPGGVTDELDGLRTVDWVIVGGESGPGARPMHPDWPKALRDQCVAAGVPFFFKQWGEWMPYQESGSPPLWDSQRGDSIDSHCFPDCLIEGNPAGQWYAPELDGVVYRKVGKKRAGRLLDGREWGEMPRVGSEATAS